MSGLVATFDAKQLRDLAGLDGLYVGMLDKAEQRLFQDAEDAGLAYRVYADDVSAMLGLSKVKIGTRATHPTTQQKR